MPRRVFGPEWGRGVKVVQCRYAPQGAEDWRTRSRRLFRPCRGGDEGERFLFHGFRSGRPRRPLLHPWLHSDAPFGALLVRSHEHTLSSWQPFPASRRIG
jgi:hypothetical protein